MSDRTREETLEALLRVALRKLGGCVYLGGPEELERRPREGEIEIVVNDPGRNRVELPGVLTADECLSILVAIDDGDDPIVEREPWEPYSHPRFKTKAGHVVQVYNRGGDWRYVDQITHADGRHWEYFDGCMARARLDSPGDWEPSHPKVWGIK